MDGLKSGIRAKHPGSATLCVTQKFFCFLFQFFVFFQREADEALAAAGRVALAAAGANQPRAVMPPPNPIPGLHAVPPGLHAVPPGPDSSSGRRAAPFCRNVCLVLSSKSLFIYLFVICNSRHLSNLLDFANLHCFIVCA